MAQLIESSFICDGRFRVLAVNSVGRKIGRIIEIEEVDTGKRVHGTARKLERLMLSLRRSEADTDGARALQDLWADGCAVMSAAATRVARDAAARPISASSSRSQGERPRGPLPRRAARS
jgi:hypothetical protein